MWYSTSFKTIFSCTLVKNSIGCVRQESEIKRQQERGCKHRGNWIMPLVGENELSFFSISFTICFYLVINESSVWWQQAAGCVLAAAATQPVRPHYVSFTHIHTCRCNQPCTHNICTRPHTRTVACSHFSASYTLNPGCSSKNENMPFTHRHFVIFILSGTLTPLTWWFYCFLKIFSWLYLIIFE